jgi:2-oxoglutarate ferredoxin oxidoreductase subunit beta
MSTELKEGSAQPYTVKDVNTENPRWCAGCGDFGITMGVKKFMVDKQLPLWDTVHVSGIGCSGRAPNYYNTYGVHGIHGRAIPIALGIALSRPDLNLFVHSGDGDALSIGGNHLLHGINKNFNCVFLLYDNELYALTKSQTSPTTRKGHATNTQPSGTYLDPLNAVQLVLGIGASFVASTADWIPDHLSSTIKAAFDHKGFSFVHISQRCPHYDPAGFDYKNQSWFSFLNHPDGIAPDKRLAEKTEIVEHDPSDLQSAFKFAQAERRYFGLFYRNSKKACYDDILRGERDRAEQKDPTKILDRYRLNI